MPKACPFDGGRNYGRDGFMRFGGNGGRSVNYEPNGFSGPVQTGEPLWVGFDDAHAPSCAAASGS